MLLSVWALFLAWLLTYGRGDLIRLLHPRLWWVLCIAVFVLILFLASLLSHHGHTGEKKTILSLLPGIVILLIPLLYYSMAKDARLDGSVLQNRIIQNDDGIYLNNLPPFELFDESSSPDMLFSKLIRDPTTYEDQDVEIVCQSFTNEQLPENTAMCYRYMITCCAADALPAFIFLNHHSSLEVVSDRWIKVRGPVSIIRNNGMEFPSLQVDDLDYVEEPAFPWAM